MSKLVIINRGLHGIGHDLSQPTTTIGRSEENHFRIPDVSVSRRHCVLVNRGESFEVKDLDSSNGTFINDHQVKEGILKTGEILRVGEVNLRLEPDSDGKVSLAGATDQTVLVHKNPEHKAN